MLYLQQPASRVPLREAVSRAQTDGTPIPVDLIGVTYRCLPIGSAGSLNLHAASAEAALVGTRRSIRRADMPRLNARFIKSALESRRKSAMGVF